MAIDVEKPPPGKEETVSQAIVGIIYPPPEVRNIVDKTAYFVARNGPEFESKICQNEIGNPKFNFLNPGDPYHAYYQHRVRDIREGKVKEAPAPAAPKALTSATQQKQQELLKQVATEQPFVPKDPPKEFEFVADPPSISALDLDIVKLTAQFVARNGRGFLTSLMQKEQRNFQFDFLRPQHSLFQYFTKLLEQYTKILIPPKDMMFRLKDEASSTAAILEEVKYRADYLRYQEAQRKQEEARVEKDRVAYAQIDWHDFVVVETVDYMPGEPGNFPPPTTPDEVGARVLMQERMDNGEEDDEEEEEMEEEYEGEKRNEDDDDMQIGSDEENDYYNARMRSRRGPNNNNRQIEEDNMEEGTTSEEDSDEEANRKLKEAKDNTQVQDMEEDSSDEEEEEDRMPSPPPPPSLTKKVDPAPPPPPPQISIQPPPLPPAPDKVVVKKGYDPKQARAPVIKPSAADEYLISPITGEKIPASKVQEHMRIGLLDPRWVEQRDKHLSEKINQDTVYAPGTAIEASLKQLAERRTDIFGVGDEETAIGKKIGEEDTRKDDKVTWDGHTSSVESATRAARANITLEDQIHQIHKVKGLLPDEEKEKIGPKRSHSSAPPLPRPMPPKPKMAPPPLPPPPPVLAPPPPPKIMIPPPPPVQVQPPPPPMMMIPPGMIVTPGGFQPGPPGPPPQVLPPGFVPPPPPGPPMGRKHPAPEPLHHEEEFNMPGGKKMRTEESLMPEHMFLSKMHTPNVTFSVVVPNMSDKPEWKLNGQTLALSLDLRASVTTLKSKISELIGMPAGKQKLCVDGLFFKDSNSLAYYNITPGCKVHLQLKERGGRKK
uniref:Splicing factor 3A subunit 1 n=1 Tax=Cacopsylla melanoneura TaxID=428564 RepID=A0A8D9DQP7_9HEMI